LSIGISILICCCQTKDVEKEKQVMMNTDIEFSNMSVEKGMIVAFLSYAADNGVMLRNNGYPIVGKDSISKGLQSRPDSSFILTWSPLFAEISASCDLGYTYGTFKLELKDSVHTINDGTYLTIWKKQTDGTWKWVLDTGNDGLKKK
jgi:ketosteroid isomerase-like protein